MCFLESQKPRALTLLFDFLCYYIYTLYILWLFLIKIEKFDPTHCYINYPSANELFATSFAGQSVPGLSLCDLLFF